LVVHGTEVPPPENPPASPSGLAATAVSSSRIDLAWSDNSDDESGFRIERSTNGSDWSQIATVGANVKSYSATGLSASTTYYFRVRAYNAAGHSGYSNVSTATTEDPTQTGDKPGAHNTGPTDPDLLVSRGSITTTH